MRTTPSELCIVSLPFEFSTSFIKGTVLGPKAIVDEIEGMDNFEIRLGRNPYENISRKFIEPHSPDLLDPLLQQSAAQRAVKEVLDRGGFPLSLGGEHTVSIGPVRAVAKSGPLGIISLDAHADLRDEYEGSRFSHACAMRRSIEADCPLLEIGTRAMCREEWKFAQSRGIDLVNGRRAATSKDWYGLIDGLPDRIYLSIDMDYFNPCEVPAVGTPEPGGPGFEACLDFLFHLFDSKDVVAADIVELKPSAGDKASVRLAARLAGIITGLKFRS